MNSAFLIGSYNGNLLFDYIPMNNVSLRRLCFSREFIWSVACNRSTRSTALSTSHASSDDCSSRSEDSSHCFFEFAAWWQIKYGKRELVFLPERFSSNDARCLSKNSSQSKMPPRSKNNKEKKSSAWLIWFLYQQSLIDLYSIVLKLIF